VSDRVIVQGQLFLSPEMANKFFHVREYVYRETGITIIISSPYGAGRVGDMQAFLRRMWDLKVPGWYYAAPEGQSNHEFPFDAVDIWNWKSVEAALNKAARIYGLKRDAVEGWHYNNIKSVKVRPFNPKIPVKPAILPRKTQDMEIITRVKTGDQFAIAPQYIKHLTNEAQVKAGASVLYLDDQALAVDDNMFGSLIETYGIPREQVYNFDRTDIPAGYVWSKEHDRDARDAERHGELVAQGAEVIKLLSKLASAK